MVEFKACSRMTIVFHEKKLGRASTLHFTFYLSTALSRILLHSKTIKKY